MNFQNHVKNKLINNLTKGKGKSMNLKRMILEMVYGILKIKTPQQAEEAYIYIQHNSKEAILLLDKWNRLSLKEVKAATTSNQTHIAFRDAPDDSEAKKAAFDKGNRLSMEEIEAAITREQVKTAYYNAPYGYGSEAIKAGYDKWNRLSLEEVEVATTIEEVTIVYNNAPEKSEAKTAAIYKLISLSKTSKQANKIYWSAAHYCDKTATAALFRWNQLSMEEVEAAITIEEVTIAYKNAPEKSKAKTVALNKWNRLSLEEVEAAQTYKEALNAYNNTPDDSTSATAALVKMYEFSR